MSGYRQSNINRISHYDIHLLIKYPIASGWVKIGRREMVTRTFNTEAGCQFGNRRAVQNSDWRSQPCCRSPLAVEQAIGSNQHTVIYGGCYQFVTCHQHRFDPLICAGSCISHDVAFENKVTAHFRIQKVELSAVPQISFPLPVTE